MSFDVVAVVDTIVVVTIGVVVVFVILFHSHVRFLACNNGSASAKL